MTHHVSHSVSMTAIPDLSGRYDLYGAIHKGLRKAGCDMLNRIGTADFENPEETETVLGNLRSFIVFAASHVMHEDEHIHGVLRARGASTATLEDQHDDHRTAFATLEKLASDIEKAWPMHKQAAGRKLYLAFAAYLAEDLAHMHEEETVTAPELWRICTDEELATIEMHIIASMSPEKNMAFLRLMIPAMNPAERAAMLSAMQQNTPPEMFSAIVEFAVRPSLSEKAFSDLSERIALAA
ncbi:hemerythrin domain-containing protein [Rhizobium cremeum]|uniref:hemerythrin domain-containing protein n=1 Tax=Rhizobium cremeum TaxID=2813827 RepID=UPI000DD93DA2